MKKLLLLILLSGFAEAYSQINNPYGLQVINEHVAYKKSVEEDKNKQLIEIKKSIPDIKLEIRYAGKNNFAKQAVYKQARAFARLPVVEALKNVQNELKKSGFGLKIFDGYRPYSVTVKFFAIASDKSFVANPKDGSRHNRGCAIDLTLIDLKTGKELEMPTPYDSFAAEAASDFMNLPANVIQNRELLRNTMEKHGFRVLNNEWWHFDFIGWKNYELMDIPFEDL
ncbi:MAG: D-alanyl-D-alanine dipeptidase [Sphingobacteriales bacterium 17-39-43]|uniref:M15 family metallopeptidase n=1 Tax=Daejeonella sp. TaxID=2805397 RepID=UPI000BC59E3C|nr:M15 family metallopeptidase [Daejeonella sp.]OYY04646.1 MAG: D-alanyl-D-alanine dipeptidase [Sphingobacteriia bacterium 35-40-5]OYZ32269.1 MAG: D-alanyl-D-alanine dipeptidase [Sphingobacteriales bacterium 16-39-50]OYZ45179.1 MAG: D-alanyl-D-alanine dipeptidase [Sphingobacteriales bacterium 24-40-4]OZA25614.1 MAG: D-alanyl-D-alanine dipeptidase [Sphingobacteriales bacterium 17-39-43]OZA61500.1 MAG: D-alanyl-D-alanine dipeptidase [Sphingobacteriales bacterium 39-40-5]